MSNRIKGTLLGVAVSLAAVALWVILAVVVDIIAGYAGALMGISFFFIYKKFNVDDKSKYVYIFAVILIIVEIIAAEMISLAIIAGKYSLSIGAALAVKEVQNAVLIDIAIGLVLSFAVFIAYVYSLNKKEKAEKARNAIELKMKAEKENKQENQEADGFGNYDANKNNIAYEKENPFGPDGE